MKEEVLDPGFLDGFPNLSYEGRQPHSEQVQLKPIMDEFKRLRMSDEQIYLRSASVNRHNGMVGMNFPATVRITSRTTSFSGGCASSVLASRPAAARCTQVWVNPDY